MESRHVAFDGKALRGTHGHEAAHHPPVHLCAFYEVTTGNVLAQREVREKENAHQCDQSDADAIAGQRANNQC